MGGAQPLAVTMNGGVCLVAEVDRARIERRLETRYLDAVAPSIARRARRRRPSTPATAASALSVGLVGNAADLLPRLVATRHRRPTS